MRMSVKDVAKLMNASEQFVRRGLQSGVFQWGYAVGIEVENERL